MHHDLVEVDGLLKPEVRHVLHYALSFQEVAFHQDLEHLRSIHHHCPLRKGSLLGLKGLMSNEHRVLDETCFDELLSLVELVIGVLVAVGTRQQVAFSDSLSVLTDGVVVARVFLEVNLLLGLVNTLLDAWILLIELDFDRFVQIVTEVLHIQQPSKHVWVLLVLEELRHSFKSVQLVHKVVDEVVVLVFVVHWLMALKFQSLRSLGVLADLDIVLYVTYFVVMLRPVTQL